MPPPGPEMGVPVASGRAATLTAPAGQSYHFGGDATHTTAHAAPTETNPNIRTLFWGPEAPYVADQQVCLTWDDPATTLGRPYPQPGLAFRIAPSGPAGTGIRAVTITQNVFGRAIWIAWVNTWDTSKRATPDPVTRFDLYPIVSIDSNTMRSPWHVCGRVRGDEIDFKVWIDGAEPTWNDPHHVFSTHLPAGWDTPGYAGGYIGHLQPGAVASFSDIEVRAG